ncbi:hypothetical protein L6164_007652 [Bauhinia variegata]|uniref:Uncharacterized protein n=1 Tax=Bauhinia variegata TaxID=167791 RepID=A0ACB9PD82_BAUVA|nr:hypothetical protein L6164_007652 [Bauhinia variegata]
MKLPSFPEYEIRVRYATGHRCGVVVKGPNLSGNISGTDPLKDNRLLLKAEALEDSHVARHTAAVFNELSREITKILVSHPVNAKRVAEGKNIANVVLLRGCGIRIEAINDEGHDKASILKVKGLEAIDRAIAQLARLLWEAESTGNFQYILCVTGDHSTPVEYGDHSFEPVPFSLSVERLHRCSCGDSVYEFNEIAGARGCLGRFHGGEMMGIIKKFLNLDACAAILRG